MERHVNITYWAHHFYSVSALICIACIKATPKSNVLCKKEMTSAFDMYRNVKRTQKGICKLM